MTGGAELDGYLAAVGPQLRAVRLGELEVWPAGDALVLEEDTSIELGNPATGSLAAVLWAKDDQAWVADGQGVSLVGPDLDRIDGRRDVAFGRILQVAPATPSPDDEAAYRRHLALQDAIAARQGALDGFLVRSRPSLRRIWCRVDRHAVEAGRSLLGYGAALLEATRALDFVGAARVVLVVDRAADLERLRPSVEAAARAAAALVKRNEEEAPECERCDYADICEEGSAR